MSTIRYDDLCFGYDKQPLIFDHMNMTFDSNKVNVLLGKSGVGKSTLLALTAGLLQPVAGNISCDSCSYVFQQSRLVEEMTALQNIELVLMRQYKDKNARKKLITDALQNIGLQGLENRFVSQLSGGQRQRVALVRAFLYQSKVMLLDEPFSALDSSIKMQLCQDFIQLLGKDTQRTVLFVTHDVDVAMAVGDSIFVMRDQPAKIHQLCDLSHISRTDRDLYSQQFNKLRKELNEALQY